MGQLRAAEMRVMSHEGPWLETGGPVGIFSPPFSPESHSTNVSGLGSASEPVKPALVPMTTLRRKAGESSLAQDRYYLMLLVLPKARLILDLDRILAVYYFVVNLKRGA